MQDRDAREIIKAFEIQLKRLAAALGVDSLSLEDVGSFYKALARENPIIAVTARERTKEIFGGLIQQASVDVVSLDLDPSKFQTLDSFGKFLEKSEDLTPDQLEAMLNAINNLVSSIRRQILESASVLPEDPGGRERSFTLSERRKVFNEITKYLGGGMKLKAIFEKLAQRYNCSPSTIRRVWYEDKPPIIDE